MEQEASSNPLEKEKAITEVKAEEIEEQQQPPLKKEITYLQGWRFHLVSLAIGVGVCLVNMEVSIVSTSLVTIANDFQGFDQSNWIVIAYLGSYTGFMLIWSKLSDVFGRKWTFNTATFMFLAFSAACGASQSLNQLIICRAFQGMSASGVFSVSLVMFYELVPKPKYPLYGSLVSAITGVSVLIGPIVGGAINTKTTWRWVFLLNIPGAFIILLLMAPLLPNKFPYHGHVDAFPAPKESVIALIRKVDFLGAFFLLSASFLITAVLLEVSTRFAWSSAFTICLLVIGILLYLAFFAWERLISSRKGKQEPMFPWYLARNRMWMGVALTSFLVGIPSTVVIITIPQRFQIVSGDSPLDAGLTLVAYTVCVPIGTIIVNTIAGKTKLAPIFFLIVGAFLQVLGLGLMLTLPATGPGTAPLYVYEVLIALGVGTSFGILVLANPHTIEPQYIASAAGSLMLFRMTGSTIGLAIVTSVMNGQLTSNLSGTLTSSQLSSILQSISSVNLLPENLQDLVIETFGRAYRVQIQVLIGLAAAQFLTVSLMWRKPQLQIHHH